MIEIRSLVAGSAGEYFDDVARLRIEVFRSYPYLYAGSLEYERRYLATYAAATESLFVLAFDQGRVVGASTGMPLDQETAELREPWQRAGIDPACVFYFGESVLLPNYRGQGIGHRFFDEREAYARKLGRFDRTSFCAVYRPDDHPARPDGYRPLHGFWRARGYAPHADLHCLMRWREIGHDAETEQRLDFWSRALETSD